MIITIYSTCPEIAGRDPTRNVPAAWTSLRFFIRRGDADILEAAAVAAFHAQLGFPVVTLLLCDDAPQFNWVTKQLALCWIHEGRHYKKLAPRSTPFKSALADFTQQFWQYYDELLAYRQQPSANARTLPGDQVRHLVQHDDRLPHLG